MAAADAAQERLELESKMMDLQAKKEEMNVLVAHLQQLRELQLAKGAFEIVANAFLNVEKCSLILLGYVSNYAMTYVCQRKVLWDVGIWLIY